MLLKAASASNQLWSGWMMPQEHQRQRTEIGPSGEHCGQEGEAQLTLTVSAFVSAHPCPHLDSEGTMQWWEANIKSQHHKWTVRRLSPQRFLETCLFSSHGVPFTGIVTGIPKRKLRSFSGHIYLRACMHPPTCRTPKNIFIESYRNMYQGKTLSQWTFHLQV